MNSLRGLVAKQQIIVCCGAGGVGKTSVSSALGLAAARSGRRVLVITIDPAKRLGETLGLDKNPGEPVVINTAIQKKMGIAAPGCLSAWLLDPQKVADRVVSRFAHDAAEAETLLQNPMYKNISSMVTGMQEYTAVQAMYEYATSGRYDLIVLDTPPSRNALNFLQAPGRIGRFVEDRFFRLFTPGKDLLVGRVSIKVITNVLELAFGTEASADLLSFLGLFSHIIDRLGPNAAKVQELFRKPTTSFIVVTSPDQVAIDDADYFGQKSRGELGVPLAGYIFNRSILERADLPDIKQIAAACKLSPPVLKEMEQFALEEKHKIAWQQGQFEKIKKQLRAKEFLIALPFIPAGVNDLPSLTYLADSLQQ